MRKTRKLVFSGIYVALLLGGQFALSGVAGIEIVTALFFCFCYCFGILYGLIVGNVFSLIRCFIFGFYPSVLILYIVYYSLFAVFVGLFGKNTRQEINLKTQIVAIIISIILPVIFTLLDDVITPLYYGLTADAMKGYFISSLYVLLPQVGCSVVTVNLLFRFYVPLLKRFIGVKNFEQNKH